MIEEIRVRGALWVAAVLVPLVATVLAASTVDGDARWVIVGAAVAIGVMLVAGWAAMVRPLSRRIADVRTAARTSAGGGHWHRIDDHAADDFAGLGRDLDALGDTIDTERRRRHDAEHRLDYASSHDGLTGLLNRAHAIDEIHGHLDSGGPGLVSIVHVDVDNFRSINEVWGYQAGDEVLVELGNRIRRLVSDQGTVCRWSGDEFMVILVGIARDDVDELSDRIRETVAQPIDGTSGSHRLVASVGSAEATVGTGVRIDHLLHAAADRVAEEKRRHRAARRIDPDTVHLVETALDDEHLEVWYQPIVRVTGPMSTRLVGAEALVRLRDRAGAYHLPADFFGEIHTSGWARRIDRKVAEVVIADLVRWREAGLAGASFLLSLNLSPASLADPELSRTLGDLCDQAGVEPSAIVLELSEEAGELDQIIAAELRRFGFRLSIDDLGLKRSNFDRLFTVGAEFAKLHRRWLDDEVMVSAMADICRGKGLEVVAEGVETADQLRRLHEHGISLCQGYLINPPIEREGFEALMANGR